MEDVSDKEEFSVPKFCLLFGLGPHHIWIHFYLLHMHDHFLSLLWYAPFVSFCIGIDRWHDVLIKNEGFLHKLIYNINLIKIPTGFSAETDKLILKIIWKCKGPRGAQQCQKKKKNKVGV